MFRKLLLECWPFQLLYLVELFFNLCICFAIMTLKLDLVYLILIRIVSGRRLRCIYKAFVIVMVF